MKTCSVCRVEKPLAEFGRQKTGRDGLRANCKACHSADGAKWKAENKERIRITNHANYMANRDARLTYNKEWNRTHPESTRKSWRLYRERVNEAEGKPPPEWGGRTRRTKVEIKEQKRAWTLANPDKVAAHKRVDYERHSDAVKARVAKWVAENPMKRRAQVHKRLALKAGAAGARYTTAAHIEARWAMFGNRCYYCGVEATSTDHRIPLARGGSHWPSNLVPCCKTCNSRKHARTEKQFKEVMKTLPYERIASIH